VRDEVGAQTRAYARKPIARRAEHSGVGDLVFGLRQFIGNLIKGGDQGLYWINDAPNRKDALIFRHINLRF
jgi:hypothetical protein